ncbi:MAG TPA: ribonuclease P protein subunit [Thermoplasmata archaeon]|nr:ribonuclease P protein subunit [Thermoplasmata archaeon]HIH97940.1 ribonuclease P protein subunit [Thermoplasmata archaeon]
MDKIKRLMKGELIGLKVSVVHSKDPSLVGVDGKIVDETKKLLIIESKKNEKKVAKSICEFEFPEKKCKLSGTRIVCRPEDRIKKVR